MSSLIRAHDARRWPRAVLATPRANTDPSSILAELRNSFGDFQNRNDRRLDTIESAIDDLALRGAANSLSGSGGNAAGRAVRSAFGSFIRTGSTAELLALAPQAAMTTDSDPDGGFLVPYEISSDVISLQRAAVAMRKLARVQPISSSAFHQPINKHGSVSGWVGEEQARPATGAVQLGMISIEAHELYANPGVSQRLIDNSAIDIAAFLSRELADEFNAQEGSTFINGNGVNKPRGLLTYPTTSAADATRPFGTFQYVASGEAATLSADPDGADALKALVFALRAQYRVNARWLMNSTTAGVISTLKDGAGRYIWNQSLIQGSPDTLLGYPVAYDEGMPDIGANALAVAFGDFQSGYMIVDRFPIRTLRDPLTNKPYVQFYTTKRVGGGALDTQAIKFLKIAAN